jgi:hypothetical protein
MGTVTHAKSRETTGHIDFAEPARNATPRTIKRPRMLLSPALAMAGISTRQLFLGGVKIPEVISKQPERSPGRGRNPAVQEVKAKRLANAPRLGPLKVRKRLLAAKCRAAGVRSPMALALAK